MAVAATTAPAGVAFGAAFGEPLETGEAAVAVGAGADAAAGDAVAEAAGAAGAAAGVFATGDGPVFGAGALAAGRAGAAPGRAGSGALDVAGGAFGREGDPIDAGPFAGPMATSAKVGRLPGTGGLAADGAGAGEAVGADLAAGGDGEAAGGDGDAAEADGDDPVGGDAPRDAGGISDGSPGGIETTTGAVPPFGTVGASEPQPSSGGGSVVGAGGISLIGMTKPHLRHFIRTERPVTFSSAI